MRTLKGVSMLSAAVVFLPYMTSAATLMNTLSLFNTFLNALIGLFVTLAIVVFFWGLIQYLVNDGENKVKGLNRMLMGAVSIFVMVSIWGIIRLLQNTFQVTSTDPIIPKGIQINTGSY